MNISDLTQAHKESMPWLAASTILVARSGSHAYGTSLPTSDLDFKGVAIPPEEYFIGFVRKFEQAEQREPYDAVIYDIRKFCNLAADCNPSIIETLFVNDSDVIHCTDAGEILRINAGHFLSKKAKHTFSGYAYSQLQRIQGHHKWLTNPPKKEPTRADFNLPENTAISADQRAAAGAAIQKKLDEWSGLLDFDQIQDPALVIGIRNQIEKYLVDIKVNSDDIYEAAGKSIGLDTGWLEVLKNERGYRSARTEWTQYQTWLRQRNPARAALEAKYGYDTKHGMHLVRLMRMGYEILTTGVVMVKRPDAEELLAIRAGLWPYEQIVQYAEDMDKKMQEAYEKSHLPKAPDRNKLDEICAQLVNRELFLVMPMA